MEKIAWFEIVGPHGNVLSRHPVQQWPLRVGRAYDSDVVLDDPYTAAHHLEIQGLAEGRYQLTALSTLNGLHLGRKRASDACIAAGETARIGQTHFRLCPSDGLNLAPERALPATGWWKHWLWLLLAFGCWSAEYMLVRWLDYDRADAYHSIFLSLFEQFPTLLLWAAFWSFLGRMLTGRSAWLQQGTLALLGDALYETIGDSAGYISFITGSHLVESLLQSVAQPMLFAAVLYLHLRLATHLHPRSRWLLAIGIVLGMEAFFAAKVYLLSSENSAETDYVTTIAPPQLTLTPPKTTAQFLRDMKKLQQKLDAKNKS